MTPFLLASAYSLAALPFLAPSAVLPGLFAGATLAGGVLLFNYLRAKVPAPAAAAGAGTPFAEIFTHLNQMFHQHGTNGQLSHRLAGGARALARYAIEWDKAQDHKDLNAVLAHFAPGLAPLLPALDKGIDALENHEPDFRQAAIGFVEAYLQQRAKGRPAAAKTP